MPYRRELAFRKLKREFDRFPNMDFVEPMNLGQIGIYNGRRANFNWRTNLSRFDISISPQRFNDLPPIIDEIYTSDDAVNYEFKVDDQKLGVASFSFSKSYSLASQAIDLITEGYEIRELEQLLLDKIRSREIEWEREWSIVTQVFKAASFSLLIASGKDGVAEIKTQKELASQFFNIADPNLDLVLTKSKKLAYRIIGKQNIIPFFRIHKFKGDWTKLNLKLEPYGR